MGNKKIGVAKDYVKLSKMARRYDHTKFLNEIISDFGFLNDKSEMDKIALHLQVCIKESKPLYLHGYVISSALNKYIQEHREIEDFVVFETGTARGFSAIVMANILKRNNVRGRVHTIDLSPHHERMYWNCIDDHSEGAPKSRHQLLDKWSDLRDNYCNFLTGNSKRLIGELNYGRIHFAFLDGAHFYEDLKNELNFVERQQVKGDVIVCDDYTIKQYPEICKAIDEFLARGLYDHKVYYGEDGVKRRGYVYMVRR